MIRLKRKGASALVALFRGLAMGCLSVFAGLWAVSFDLSVSPELV